MTDENGLAKAYLEQCPAIIWAVDQTGAFHKFFSDPSSVFGKSAAELKDQAPEAALDSGTGKQWKNRFARALAGETLMLRERRGDITWYVKLFPIRLDGRISFVGGVAQESGPWSTAGSSSKTSTWTRPCIESRKFSSSTSSRTPTRPGRGT